jgi:hypothetical protein
VSIAVTTLSSGLRPTADAYSARSKTGLALKNGADMSRDMAASGVTLFNRYVTIYEILLDTSIEKPENKSPYYL